MYHAIGQHRVFKLSVPGLPSVKLGASVSLSPLPPFNLLYLSLFPFIPSCARRGHLRVRARGANLWSAAVFFIPSSHLPSQVPGESPADVSSWLAIAAGQASNTYDPWTPPIHFPKEAQRHLPSRQNTPALGAEHSSGVGWGGRWRGPGRHRGFYFPPSSSQGKEPILSSCHGDF